MGNFGFGQLGCSCLCDTPPVPCADPAVVCCTSMIIVRTNVPQSVIGVLFFDSQEFQVEEYIGSPYVACNAYEIPIACCGDYALYGTSNSNAGNQHGQVYPYRLYFGTDIFYDFKSRTATTTIGATTGTGLFVCDSGYMFVKEYDTELQTTFTTVIYNGEMKYQMTLWLNRLALLTVNEYVVAVATDSASTSTGTRYIFYEGVLKFTWSPSYSIVAYGKYTFMRPDSTSPWVMYLGDVPLLTFEAASLSASNVVTSDDSDYIGVETPDGFRVFHGTQRIFAGTSGSSVSAIITGKTCVVTDRTALAGFSYFEGNLITEFYAGSANSAYLLYSSAGGDSVIVKDASQASATFGTYVCLYIFEGRIIWEGRIGSRASTTTSYLCTYISGDYVFILERSTNASTLPNIGWLYHKGVMVDGPFENAASSLDPTATIRSSGNYVLLELSRFPANSSYEVRVYYNQIYLFSTGTITSTSVLNSCGNIAFITGTSYIFVSGNLISFDPEISIGNYWSCCEDSLIVYVYASSIGQNVVAQLTADGEMYIAPVAASSGNPANGQLDCCGGVIRLSLSPGTTSARYYYIIGGVLIYEAFRGASNLCEGSKAFLHTGTDSVARIITKQGVILETPYLDIAIAQPGCCNSRIFILVDENTLITYDDGYGLMKFNPRTFTRIDDVIDVEAI